MPRMMVHPHSPTSAPVPKPVSPMTYRLRRQTPNCGYAEIDVISHNGSHHRPGDVVLIDWSDYERGQYIVPPNAFEPQPKPTTKKEMSQAVADFLAINPHIHAMADGIPPKRSKTNDTRRKTKSKSKEAARRL